MPFTIIFKRARTLFYAFSLWVSVENVSFQIRDVLKREADWHMNKNEWRIEIETAHHAHGEESQGKWRIGRGVVDDLRRKMRYYTSDYIDGKVLN